MEDMKSLAEAVRSFLESAGLSLSRVMSYTEVSMNGEMPAARMGREVAVMNGVWLRCRFDRQVVDLHGAALRRARHGGVLAAPHLAAARRAAGIAGGLRDTADVRGVGQTGWALASPAPRARHA